MDLSALLVAFAVAGPAAGPVRPPVVSVPTFRIEDYIPTGVGLDRRGVPAVEVKNQKTGAVRYYPKVRVVVSGRTWEFRPVRDGQASWKLGPATRVRPAP